MRRIFVAIATIGLVVSLCLATTAHAAEYTAPATIPADCSADTTAALGSWLATVPDGNTATLAAGGCYRLDGTLELRDRVGLDLNLNGATLQAATLGAGSRAHLRLMGGSGWTVRDGSIRGVNPACGAFNSVNQWQHGIDLRGTQGTTILRIDIRDTYGDTVYMGKDDRNGQNARDIVQQDTVGICAGRVGVAAFVAVERATVLGGFYEMAGLNAIDVEPNNGNLVSDIVVDGVEIGRWPTRQWQFAIVGPPSGTAATVRNVTLRNARFTGSPFTFRSDLAGDKLKPENVRVENNTGLVTYEGPLAPIVLHNTSGAVVTGNSQAVSGGQYGVYACNVTGLAVSGNSFPGAAAEFSSAIKRKC